MAPELLIAVLSVFVAVFAITVLALTYVVTGPAASVRRRLGGFEGRPAERAAAPVSLADAPDPRLQRLSRLMPKSPKDMARSEKYLARAGWTGPLPVLVYSLSEILLPILLATAALSVLGLRRGLIAAAIAGFVGYLLPGFYLSHRVERRQRLIANGLPDALDLLVVCVEAGLSLDQAIVKASEELVVSHRYLAQELQHISTEIRAGKPRMEAIRNFAERTKVDDVQSLVATLIQTDRFGTSVAQALRTHADVSRTKRRQNAEERAQKLGVKLVFPLVFCLFPAFYVVVLGPAVIQFVRVFFGQLMQR